MSVYEPTIGMEIHAELRTATKMFCRSKNDADEVHPNVNICPVCLAHPGTLPVINHDAIKSVLRVGLALRSQLADYTEFDRKSYFYPDLPKGYQISQYEYPLVSGGELDGVAITRIHLEEDTASSAHDDGTGMTLIDFNRSGIPLMELVTEPVIKSVEQAGNFARELQLLLRYLGVSDANMEKGEMRVEANISVAKPGERGTKVEIKNLNSFRVMEKAVAYEIKRQIQVLEKGGTVVQETRGWDENKQATFSQRIKEGSADYRYFPDPDLPSMRLSELPEFAHAALMETMPELPSERRARYRALGIKKNDAELYVRNLPLAGFLDQILGMCEGDKERITLASNYLANDLVNMLRDREEPDSEIRSEINISPRNFNKIIDMLAEKRISSRSGKDLLLRLMKEDFDPEAEAAKLKLFIEKADLRSVVSELISEHPTIVVEYKAGKVSVLEFLVGQGMRKLRGAADAAVLRDMIRDTLS